MDMSVYADPYFAQPLPENAVLIVGAGHFGQRAVRMLSGKSDSPVYVVDRDQSHLARINDRLVKPIVCDGIRFLVENFPFFSPSNIVIPAVPVHLAFEWLITYLSDDFPVKRISVPEDTRSSLPHTWHTGDGSLLVSYADFRCPDDCPEPADYCTVTGEKRDKPLYQLLGELHVMDFNVHVIRSHQLAPGLGGYRVDNLLEMVRKITSQGAEKWMIGTACKCHGTLSAMEVHRALKRG
jgi:hypothetical protein